VTMAMNRLERPVRELARFWGIALRTPPVAVGLALLGLAIVIHIPTLNQPLLETQWFRQTTTAYPALLFHEQGIDLLRPQLPVFGPPFVLPIEFPLFQAAAAILMDLGVPADPAMRITALVCFLITAVLVWRLLVAIAGEAAGLAGLAAFLFSPLGLLISRMSLIEYMATAGALAFIFWGLRWHEIELLNDRKGKPLFRFSDSIRKKLDGKKIQKVHVSISHTAEYAVAFVVFETGRDEGEKPAERI